MDFLTSVDRLQNQLSKYKRRDLPGKTVDAASDSIVPWDWVAIKLSNLLLQYPAGITEAIVLTELESQWADIDKQYQNGTGTRYHSIDHIYNGSFSSDCIVEVTIEKFYYIPGTCFTVLVVSDNTSIRKVELLLHQKFTFLLGNHVLTSSRPFLEKRKVKLAVVGVVVSKSSIETLSGSQPQDAEKMTRVSKLPRIPPTEQLVFLLSATYDRAFVTSQFSSDCLSDLRASGTRRYKLWLKLLHIDKAAHTSSAAAYGTSRGHYLKLYLCDTSDEGSGAILTLYDHQISLSSMLKKGDFIGLYHPGLIESSTESQTLGDGCVLLEYTNETVIFCMPEQDAEAAELTNLMKKNSSSDPSRSEKSASQAANSIVSQLSDFAGDNKDVMDCRMYKKRVYIKNLRSHMINVTLFGRIVAMANNNPYRGGKGDQPMDRYAIRLVDETAQIDVTLWEAVGHRARRLREGHYVLITGLSTSKLYKDSNGQTTWYVNGSTSCGTEIVNVSTIQCLLASSCFRKIVGLNTISNYEQCHVCATVTGWYISHENGERRLWEGEIKEDGTVIEDKNSGVRLSHTRCYGHKSCLRSVTVTDDGQLPYCSFCACSVYNQQDLVRIFAGELDEEGAVLYWTLDDGTGEVVFAEAGQDISAVSQ
ncbi:hypothetical protein K450DRAFT_223542 [Umbelopsis ramanniana AG]|uniref:Uncharacterized protein n=1 Tax=Umbelopsis ramanniana AG TaxID=1314678 RepID=A0AAD5HGD9_UMBRA|nr:uncharacterized protein K450DRAFT_223542 [Umbelopsis ramanniana AG]KAI8583412.1 hypothetical protein K450DRAFT_223542 [Umbelopsis ramanniana AG]